MAPKFGTSGLRGLVSELTPALVADHVRAFLRACPVGTGLYVARDLRPSSPAIADVVIATARGEGVAVTDCGAVPTPALALAAMGAGAAAVIVTGSHIPADRNGLKFYIPTGEITKADEAAITAALGGAPAGGPTGTLVQDHMAGPAWVARYVTAFGTGALSGRRIGVWTHSAVSRDLLLDALSALGAEVVELGRSNSFIPVDTEAIPEDARAAIRGWVAEHRLDALVSTDGDGDRPLLADERGEVVPGDILGQITAQVVGAEVVVTPVTSNSGAELGGHFRQVIRTKVGSTFVIAGMARATGKAAGYEANGGFLLGFDATPKGPLPRLPTRDSLLPLVAVLAASRASGSLSARVGQEPPRATASGLLRGIDSGTAAPWLARLSQGGEATSAFAASLGEEILRIDLTDGVRLIFRSGSILHLRSSGNAPELRILCEAHDPTVARTLHHKAREGCGQVFGQR